ncbi:MAG TPA: GTPase, partial [Casimicrobiaceae bacterium]
SKAKFALMRRFFETVASRAKHVYDIANRDVESWLKAVMAPLETQVREHHLQLRRRLESIRRIHQASDELEDRITELEQSRDVLLAQVEGLSGEVASIAELVETADALPLAANSEAA